MQRIYDPADLIEAQMLIGMLESEGIRCHLAGAYLLGALGELPLGGLLGLLVDDAEAARASALIAAYNGAEPIPGDLPDACPGDLIC